MAWFANGPDMKRLLPPALLAALILAPAPAATAVLGPEADACRPGARAPAVLVNVKGFRRQAGTIRVQLHGGNAATWLGDKTHMKRIELPVSRAEMPVCVRVPRPGRYAIAVRHDEDGDRKMTRHDGGGYSGNPDLSIARLKPAYDESAFTVGNGVAKVDVVMNYLFGLSVRPVR